MAKSQVFTFEGDTFLLVDSKRHGKFLILIDAEDAERIAGRNWCMRSSKENRGSDRFYFMSSVKNTDGLWRATDLHRFIMLATDGVQVDHAKHNYLDLRRSELRLATHSQNNCNQRKRKSTASMFKGVRHHKHADKWQAHIGHNHKWLHIGYFPLTEQGEIDAAKAYDKKALELFGDFALLNFPAA